MPIRIKSENLTPCIHWQEYYCLVSCMALQQAWAQCFWKSLLIVTEQCSLLLNIIILHFISLQICSWNFAHQVLYAICIPPKISPCCYDVKSVLFVLAFCWLPVCQWYDQHFIIIMVVLLWDLTPDLTLYTTGERLKRFNIWVISYIDWYIYHLCWMNHAYADKLQLPINYHMKE